MFCSSDCNDYLLSILVSTIAITLCDICMPEAFWSLTPSPSPNGEGSDHRDTPPCPPYVQQPFSSLHQTNRGNLTYYSPLHSERGWGWGLCEFCMPEAFCGFETVRKKVLLNLWVLWEKNLPSELFVCYLIEWVCSISHRKTQKNRIHKGHRDIKSTDNTERYS